MILLFQTRMSSAVKTVAIEYKDRFFELEIDVTTDSDASGQISELSRLTEAFLQFSKGDVYFGSKLSNHFPVFESFNAKFNRYSELNHKSKVPEDSALTLKFLPNCSPVKSSNDKNNILQLKQVI